MSTLRLPCENPEHASSLDICYRSFLLDREAMRCTKQALIHYKYTVDNSIKWVTKRGVGSPEEIAPHQIRE